MTGHEPPPSSSPRLRREVGLFGAVMLGLGSIVGTGVFVSIGIAAGVVGPAVVLAIVLAAGLAVCNALSSAQLAAAYPVSGGTYEYASRLLHPAAGFTAGWMFLCAKCASGATAALGMAGYLLHAIGVHDARLVVPVALGATAALTAIVLRGIRRSSAANTAIVSITLLALVAFVIAGIPAAMRNAPETLVPFFAPPGSRGALPALLQASALMFVAYTGYGRIATLGEEVHDPRRTIPRAIIVTLIVSAILYAGVGLVAVAGAGAPVLSGASGAEAAPLEIAARAFAVPGLRWLVAVGAVTAMLGVLLNLILGLSRVLLAMGRRGDMPGAVARLTGGEHTTPWIGVLVVGGVIGGLVCVGSVKATWSFSAFTVLVYYALTNGAALRLAGEQRLYSRVFPVCGLVGCLGLAFWVEARIWIVGLVLIGVGLIWREVASAVRRHG